ncbi:PAS domain S-box-containing protein [Cyclonatronum proteinivorum]|uniref:histidine kinase n=1 Tax=Cyclonatronum proteinivorum TaxID=1457365 RepID=A0A345UPF6_9BACT|nr:PAS domain-containing protein [Cyclonatronum proteinivorum]AXJ02358.1 PAS domain S-box-containing protein [Cyclonatronum proteinivorum]
MQPHYLLNELKSLFKDTDTLLNMLDSGLADGIWFLDLENPDHQWFSDRFWEALGYDSAEMHQHPSAWMALADPEDTNRISRSLDEGKVAKDYRFDEVIRFTHKSGRYVWMRCVARPVCDKHDKPVRLLGFHHDVSSEIMLQKSKELESELIRHGFKSPEDGYWELRVHDGSVFWSSQMYHIHGVDYDFPLSLDTGLNFYSEDDQQKLGAAIQNGINNPGLTNTLELTLHPRLRDPIPALISFKCVEVAHPGETAELYLIGTFEALGDEQQTNIQLKKRLSEMEKQVFISSQTMNMGLLQFSKDLSRIRSCGYLPVLFDIPEGQNTAVHLKRKLKIIQDGRQNLFLPAVVNMIDMLEPAVGEQHWLGDFLLQYANKGKRNWFKTYLRVGQNDDGELVYKLVLHNIDDEKRRELANLEQQYFLERSQTVSGVGHFVIYLEQGTWEGSPVMLDILGVDDSFEKSVHNWITLLTPEFSESVPKAFYEAVQAQTSFYTTYQIVRPRDGALRWVKISADFVNRENFYRTSSEPTFVGTIQDVTDQMEYTRKIEEQNAFLRKLAWSQSHEVRAPLARLMGVAEALQDMNPSDPDTQMFYESILPTAKELDEVITKLNNRINTFEKAFGKSLRTDD